MAGVRSSVNPTARSTRYLKEKGYIVGSVEQNIRIPDPQSKTGWRMFKRDLFGMTDLVAVHPSKSGTLYLQVTAGMNNKGERQTKIEQAPATMPVIRAGNTIELHVWRKIKPRGVKVPNWKVARFRIRAEGTVERPRWVWDQVFEDGSEEVDASRETPSLFAEAEAF